MFILSQKIANCSFFQFCFFFKSALGLCFVDFKDREHSIKGQPCNHGTMIKLEFYAEVNTLSDLCLQGSEGIVLHTAWPKRKVHILVFFKYKMQSSNKARLMQSCKFPETGRPLTFTDKCGGYVCAIRLY